MPGIWPEQRVWAHQGFKGSATQTEIKPVATSTLDTDAMQDRRNRGMADWTGSSSAVRDEGMEDMARDNGVVMDMSHSNPGKGEERCVCMPMTQLPVNSYADLWDWQSNIVINEPG